MRTPADLLGPFALGYQVDLPVPNRADVEDHEAGIAPAAIRAVAVDDDMVCPDGRSGLPCGGLSAVDPLAGIPQAGHDLGLVRLGDVGGHQEASLISPLADREVGQVVPDPPHPMDALAVDRQPADRLRLIGHADVIELQAGAVRLAGP